MGVLCQPTVMTGLPQFPSVALVIHILLLSNNNTGTKRDSTIRKDLVTREVMTNECCQPHVTDTPLPRNSKCSFLL